MSDATMTVVPDDGSVRSATRDRWIDRIAGLLITAQAALLVWVLLASWWKQDDFVETSRTVISGQLPGSLLTPWNGHLLPGSLGLFALVNRVFAMEWWPTIVIIVAMQVVASYLTWRVLRDLITSRVFAILLFVIYVSSVITFSTTVWFSTSSMNLPLQVGIPASLLLFQRALRTPSRINSVLPALAIVITALFFEKALTITPFLILLCAAVPLTSNAPAHWIDRIRSARAPLLWMVGSTIAYGSFFLALTSGSAGGPQADLGRLSNFTLTPLTNVLVPGLVGGPPLVTFHFKVDVVIATDSAAVTIASSILLVGLIAISALLRTRWLRFWLILFGFVTMNVSLLVLAGRSSELLPRYCADIWFMSLLLVGLALGGGAHETRPFRRAEWHPSTTMRHSGIAIASVAAVLIIANSIPQIIRIKDGSASISDAGVDYLAAARASVSELGADQIDLFPQKVPAAILLPGFFAGHNTTDNFFPLFDGPWRFPHTTNAPFFVLESGEITRGRVARSASIPTSNRICAVKVPKDATIDVELNRSPISLPRFGTLTAQTPEGGVLDIRWTDRPIAVEIDSGVSTTVFQIAGGGPTVTLKASGGDICIIDLAFGNLEPASSGG